MGFAFHKLAIPDVVSIQPDSFQDNRGLFAELFKKSQFQKHGINKAFVQFNNSTSREHVLRGLHYQIHPKAQGKLISVTHGKIYDVAVDIRKGSPTFGKWVAQTLTARKKNMLWIPIGFAHGFCVLSDKADVRYYCTQEYSPECERGIIWNDPTIRIKWPIAHPLLSDKDKKYPRLDKAEVNFRYAQ